MPLYLIRYGEIGLKSRSVRSRFESQLVANIEDMFLKMEMECTVERQRGRIFLYSDDGDAPLALGR